MSGEPARAGRVIDAGVISAAGLWLLAWLVGHDGQSLLAALAPAPFVLVMGGIAGWRGRGLVVAVAPVAGALLALVATAGADTALAAGIGLALLLYGPWWLGRHLRARSDLATAGWRAATDWERRAGEAEKDARRHERTRLAGEMHDLVGHDLARAALGLGGLELGRGLDPSTREAVARARRSVTSAAEHLAHAVSALSMDRLPDPAAGEAGIEIAEIVDGIRSAGARVVLTPVKPAQVLAGTNPAVRAVVVGVVREGLTNAVKHSPGASVEISFAAAGSGGLHVVVRTHDAPITEHAPGSGRGLMTLSDAVRAIGGTVEHGRIGADHLLSVLLLPDRARGDTAQDTVAAARARASSGVSQTRRTVLWGTAALLTGAALAAVGYRTVDAATSVLPVAGFEALRPGVARAEVELPWRTRTDATDITPPPGTRCEHYSVTTAPFGPGSSDLYRLCWSDGILARKDLITRSGLTSGSIGT
ncbi:sensor histidine kinase [Pseudonocardia alni]|jgi:signal transduction histidine kinase|uniref:sensor histidine kinase n=1 Tax=Pseudonocardia alni TaxID=33907 RepID=UPI003409FD8E